MAVPANGSRISTVSHALGSWLRFPARPTCPRGRVLAVGQTVPTGEEAPGPPEQGVWGSALPLRGRGGSSRARPRGLCGHSDKFPFSSLALPWEGARPVLPPSSLREVFPGDMGCLELQPRPAQPSPGPEGVVTSLFPRLLLAGQVPAVKAKGRARVTAVGGGAARWGGGRRGCPVCRGPRPPHAQRTAPPGRGMERGLLGPPKGRPILTCERKEL